MAEVLCFSFMAIALGVCELKHALVISNRYPLARHVSAKDASKLRQASTSFGVRVLHNSWLVPRDRRVTAAQVSDCLQAEGHKVCLVDCAQFINEKLYELVMRRAGGVRLLLATSGSLLSDVVPGQTVTGLAEESVTHKKFRVLAFTDDAQLLARIKSLNSGEKFFETMFT